MPVDTYWQQALAKAQTAITISLSGECVSAFTGIETLSLYSASTVTTKRRLSWIISTWMAPSFILEDVTGAGKTGRRSY